MTLGERPCPPQESTAISEQSRGRVLDEQHTSKLHIDWAHRRKVPGFIDPQCQCRRGEQKVEYVLLTCRRFRKERSGLWDREKSRSQLGQLRLKEILTDSVSLKKAVQFMKETGLIGQSRAPNTDEY